MKTELLMPAGNLENLKTVFRYGADAVYLGGEAFGLRAMADNFTREEMAEGISHAHACGGKVYVTANIYVHNGDIPGLREYFHFLGEVRPDAVLISDPGAFMLAREVMPEVPVHISTQANNTNYLTWKYWYDQGVRRVVAARELSLREIAEIRRNIPEDMEIEAFVHGAMCISYSGRCLLSNYLTGRDANRGACTHPCRWKYALVEETRPGEYLPIEEDDRGSYIMNAKDLSMIGHIPELLSAGVTSLKVEGRMKTALYAASVAKAYREAIDAALKDEAYYREILPELEKEVELTASRGSSTGFYFGKPSAEAHTYSGNLQEPGAVFMGQIESAEAAERSEAANREETLKAGNIADEKKEEASKALCWQVRFMQKNKFFVGEELELLARPGEKNIRCRVVSIEDEEGNAMESAPHPKQQLRVCLQFDSPAASPEGMILRRLVRKG